MRKACMKHESTVHTGVFSPLSLKAMKENDFIAPALGIHLFGAPEIQLDGVPLTTLRSAKAQALFFYLAATGRVHTRPALAALLWGDMPERAARGNLRKALQQLRSRLGPYLAIDRDAVSLSWHTDWWMDVAEFDIALAGDPDSASLQTAIDLYRGDFLEGFYVQNAPDFEAWWLAERARLREAMLQSLHQLADAHAQRNELERAIALTRRSLTLEPWREDDHRRLMTWLAQNGQRSAALTQYEVCRRALEDELDVEPSLETIELFGRIRDDRLATPDAPSSVVPPLSITPRRPAFLDDEGLTGKRPAVNGRNMVPAGERLVAREDQLARLAGFLEDAQNGQGKIAFVCGEAGWGKTTLLAEFSRRAQETIPNLIVASGICTTSTGTGDPYLPFREIMRTLAVGIDQKWIAGAIARDHALRLWDFFPQAVEILATHGRHLIDSFVSGQGLLQRAAAHDSVSPDLFAQVQEAIRRTRRQDSAMSQTRIFEEVNDVLHTLATERPLLLILDDLHWADASSVNLLFHLGRRLANSHILILGGYRPEEASTYREGEEGLLAEPLNEFRRLFGDVWVHLDHMTRGEERAFIDALLDLEPNRLGAGFRQALLHQTGGHPLFTVETLQNMRERGDLYQDEQRDWSAKPNLDWRRLPARVEGVIENRIRRLDRGMQRALSAASVEGEIFTVQVVARVCNMDARALLQTLAWDVDRGHRLVREEGISRIHGRRLSRYRFRHNLFQRYLYSDLSETEREMLHEDVGDALLALYGDQMEEIAVELAYHFQAAGVPERAIPYLRQAGVRAIRLFANQEAIAHLERGIQLLDALPDAPEHSRQALEIHLALGEAQRKAGRIAEALATFQRAADLAREVDASTDLAHAAFGFEETRWRLNLSAIQSVALLEEALQALGSSDEVLRIRLLGALSRAVMASGASQTLEAGEQAIVAARRIGDPLTLYGALRNYIFANREPEKSDARIATADEMLQLAQALDDQERIAEALGSRLHEHLERGDISAMEADLKAQTRLAKELQQPFFLYTSTMFRVMRLLLMGDFVKGEQLAQQALGIGQRLGTENASSVFGFQMFTIRREQGRLPELTPVIRHFVEHQAASATWRPGLALIYSELTMEREARAAFEAMAVDDFAILPRDAFWSATLAYLAETCVFLGDETRATTLYRLLLPYDGQNIVAGFAGVSYGAASRFLGLLATTRVRWEEAETHFQAALTMNAEMGARPWLAHTQHQYAAMLMARQWPGDCVKVGELLNQALATAQELGMHSLAEKVRSRSIP